MSLAIAYEKYEYMTKRQIFNALLNAEKKYEKMKSDLENQKNLVSFLKAKSKKKINEISYTPNDETIKAIQECEQGGNSKSYNSYDDFLKRAQKRDLKMLKLEIQNSYKRDLKLAYKQNIITHKIETELKFVIDTLQSGKTLPEKPYRPHGLNGEYSGYTSCHIKANFCLIYKIAGNNLHLIRVGKHTTLYKNF